MIPPKNFYEINGKRIQSNGNEFYIECNEFNQVWLFGDCAPDFDKCILLHYDWPNKKFSIKICDIGQGTSGYYIERNLSILRDEILTMNSYLDKLKNIVAFHFDKLLYHKK
jgi:hypothetical protein